MKLRAYAVALIFASGLGKTVGKHYFDQRKEAMEEQATHQFERMSGLCKTDKEFVFNQRGRQNILPLDTEPYEIAVSDTTSLAFMKIDGTTAVLKYTSYDFNEPLHIDMVIRDVPYCNALGKK